MSLEKGIKKKRKIPPIIERTLSRQCAIHHLFGNMIEKRKTSRGNDKNINLGGKGEPWARKSKRGERDERT